MNGIDELRGKLLGYLREQAGEVTTIDVMANFPGCTLVELEMKLRQMARQGDIISRRRWTGKGWQDPKYSETRWESKR